MWKKIREFFTSRFDTYQKVLMLVGLIIGLPLSIALVAGGIAAIPFTGGASAIPAWLGYTLFIFLTTGAFISTGNYLGIMIDTVKDKEKPNNEKIGNFICCSLGLIFSIVTVPFGIAAGWNILAASATFLTTIGNFGSAGTRLSRIIDNLTNNKTIFDLVSSKPDKIASVDVNPSKEIIVSPPRRRLSEVPSLKPARRWSFSDIQGELSRRPTVKNINNIIPDINPIVVNPSEELNKKFAAGINTYSALKGSHLSWVTRLFDGNRGAKRANVYQTLFTNAKSEFEKNVIAYSLFASDDGETLQNTMFQEMGYTSLEEARNKLSKSILSEINSDDKKEINTTVLNKAIGSIVKKANNMTTDVCAYQSSLLKIRGFRCA